MAHEIVRNGSGGLAKALGSAFKHSGKKDAKTTALKHAAKKAPAKHAAKKHAKKAAKHVGEHKNDAGLVKHGHKVKGGKELRKAYHHLQRASVVISLVEKDKGGDLWELLQFGIEQYRVALQVNGKHGSDEAALGVLRAAEHLGVAGLYAARREHLVGLAAPAQDKDEKRLKKVAERLAKISLEQKGYWVRVLPMAMELVRRAEAAGDDAHMQWELGMAADALCDGLEAVE